MASEYTVTAQYTPDPGNPGNTMFINTSVDSRGTGKRSTVG